MFDPLHITATEEQCLRLLAAAAERGEDLWNLDSVRKAGIQGTNEELAPLLGMMEHYGAIVHPQHALGPGKRYWQFRVSPNAIVLLRQLDLK